MTLRCAVCCAVVLFASVWSQAADKPAATTSTGAAYVGSKVSLARSGPGLEHYATDALAAGDLVDVVDHQNGWAAIRPPVEAYSWIAADKLRPVGGDESHRQAEVIVDSAKAWLGSDVEEVGKHVSQVQLRRGELVEVIGQKEVKLAGGATETWAKIRPPIGERRWIRETELTDSPPLGATRQRAVPQFAAAGGSNDGWTDRRERSTSLGPLADALPSDRAEHNPSRSSFINARDRMKHFEDEVARLQLALTRASVDHSGSDHVAELQHEIEELLANGRNTLERGEARRLLESANELQNLVKERASIGLEKVSSADASTSQKSSTKELTHFQVQGRLMPAAYYGRPVELFAVMKDEHTTLAFVTPAPGVNLRRYVHKDVGIIGEESFPIFGEPHFVVHRVVQLDRRESKMWNFENVPWIQFLPKKEE